jgi:hypothetical protein
MPALTRRNFLTQVSIGAAAIGTLIAAHGMTKPTEALAAPEKDLPVGKFSGPVVAQIRNAPKGEVALMVGTREIVFRDRKLVARLLRAGR